MDKLSPFEELSAFFAKLYKEDLAREAAAIAEARGFAKGEARGFAWGEAKGLAKAMNMMRNMIRSFISANPTCSIQAAAAQLGVEEQLVKEALHR